MHLTRRTLLDLAAKGAGCVSLVLGGRILWDFLGANIEGATSFIYLGRADEIRRQVDASGVGWWADDVHKLVVMDPRLTGIATDHEWVALSLVCTHLGCTLRPGPGDAELICPCHGSRFSFLHGDKPPGTLEIGPATRDLPILPVVRRGERLFVDTGC